LGYIWREQNDLSYKKESMKHEFTAIFERDKEEARQSLIEAIALILEDRRDDALRGVPEDAERETVTLK
jgi:hypothetical protein